MNLSIMSKRFTVGRTVYLCDGINTATWTPRWSKATVESVRFGSQASVNVRRVADGTTCSVHHSMVGKCLRISAC